MESAPKDPPGGPGVELTGDLEVLIEEDFEGGKAETQLFLREERSRRRVRLRIDEPTGQLRHGQRVRLRGRSRGSEFDVAEVLAAEGNGEDGGSAPPAEQPAASSSDRRAVVLLVDLLDAAASATWTTDEIADTLYTGPRNVDGLYLESSTGALGFDPDADGDGLADVFGPFQIGYSSSSCDYSFWAVAADAAATAAGIDLSLYDHRVYVLPHRNDTACTWSGLAYLNCTSICRAWIGRAELPLVFAHELGHNLGLSHASSDLDNNGVKDAEYGDASGVMGSIYGWHRFNAPHADQLGWFDAFPGDLVRVKSDGIYRIHSMSADPATVPSPKVLKLPKPNTAENYYLSVRHQTGYDEQLASSYTNGASLHRFASGATRTYYIDTLEDGETFRDTANQIDVTQLGHAADGSWVDVAIELACVPQVPLTLMWPTQLTIPLLTAGDFLIAVKNRDSPSCATRTFQIEVDRAVEIAGYVETASVDLVPGEVFYTRFLGYPLGPEGSYPLSLIVNGVPSGSAVIQVVP